MTPAQQTSMNAMKSHLSCFLCNQPYRNNDPVTLMACMHTFCRGCILEHTQQHWHCPLPMCGSSVTNFGASMVVCMSNPILSAVSLSLMEMERRMSVAPDYWWWSSQKYDTKDEMGEKEGSAVGEMELVDFQSTVNGGDDDHINDDDVHKSKEANQSCNQGRTVTTIKCTEATSSTITNRNSFPPSPAHDGPDYTIQRMDPPPPNFSPACSPISIHGSELTVRPVAALDETNNVDDDLGNRTMDNVSQCEYHIPRRPSIERNNDLKSSSSSFNCTSLVDQGVTSTLPKRRPKHRDTDDDDDDACVPYHQQHQPKVLLLDSHWKWSVEQSQNLQQWIHNGHVSVLGMDLDQDGGGGDVQNIDTEMFNFDVEGITESFLSMLSSNNTNTTDNHNDFYHPPAPMSYFAISAVRDRNFSVDGSVVVPRSFLYYLAVACGLPIVYVDYLSSSGVTWSMSHDKISTSSDQRYSYPFPSEGDRFIKGATNYLWDAPRKAHEAALARHSLWRQGVGPHSGSNILLPGTDLLHEYSVVLIGDYDRPPTRGTRIVGRRKRERNCDTSNNDAGYRTRGNMCLLLRLCGAKVYDVSPITPSRQITKGLINDRLDDIEDTRPLGDNNGVGPALKDVLDCRIFKKSDIEPPYLLVMVQEETDKKTLGKQFLSQIMTSEDADVPVVSCQWLLDSIGEFRVQALL